MDTSTHAHKVSLLYANRCVFIYRMASAFSAKLCLGFSGLQFANSSYILSQPSTLMVYLLFYDYGCVLCTMHPNVFTTNVPCI
jgi:hypothetical protein